MRARFGPGLLERLRGRNPEQSGIAKETAWLVAGKVVQGVASVLATMIVARQLGPNAFGQLSLAVIIASLIASAATLGLEYIASRELAGIKSPTEAGHVTYLLRKLRIAGACLGTLAMLGVACSSIGDKYDIVILLLILAPLPLAQVGDLAEWRIIAIGESRLVAITALMISPIAAAARIGLALIGASASLFAGILVLEWTARSLVLYWLSRHHRHPELAPVDVALRARAILRESTPLLLAGIAAFVYMRIDQFMIASLLGTTQVGLYSAIVSLADIQLVLPVLALRASLPALTRLNSIDPNLMWERLSGILRMSFYLHGAVALVVCLFAEPIIRHLYGAHFSAAVPALRILVFGAPFVAVGVLSSAWLVIHQQTGHALRRTCFGATANIALNLVLIPRFGIAGAAAATVTSFAIASLLCDYLFTSSRPLFFMKIRAITTFPSRQVK